jgi:hypothetical protein
MDGLNFLPRHKVFITDLQGFQNFEGLAIPIPLKQNSNYKY